MSIYHARAIRPSGSWNRIAQCDDVSVSYDWMEESGSVSLCRAMRETGKPDGPLEFVDDGSVSQIVSIYQWADHQPSYRGTFFRPRVITDERWKQCDDIRVITASNENGVVRLCRAMLDAGKPDGDMLLTEVGVNRQYAMRCYVPSIVRWAAYPLVAVAETLQPKVVTQALLPAEVVDYRTLEPAALTKLALRMGITLNGKTFDLAQMLQRLDDTIATQPLEAVEMLARRLSVTVRYGKGNKGEALKKRINLVAIINAGHEPAV